MASSHLGDLRWHPVLSKPQFFLLCKWGLDSTTQGLSKLMIIEPNPAEASFCKRSSVGIQSPSTPSPWTCGWFCALRAELSCRHRGPGGVGGGRCLLWPFSANVRRSLKRSTACTAHSLGQKVLGASGFHLPFTVVFLEDRVAWNGVSSAPGSEL